MASDTAVERWEGGSGEVEGHVGALVVGHLRCNVPTLTVAPQAPTRCGTRASDAVETIAGPAAAHESDVAFLSGCKKE